MALEKRVSNISEKFKRPEIFRNFQIFENFQRNLEFSDKFDFFKNVWKKTTKYF